MASNGLSSSGVSALPPFVLQPDAGERLVLGDVTILVRASAEATGGAFSLFEEVPPMVDTPRHVHEREDEVFYVLEGEHVIEVGDEEFAVERGGVVFAPRRVPHAQRRVVPREGRLLVLPRRAASTASSENWPRRMVQARSALTHTPQRQSVTASRG